MLELERVTSRAERRAVFTAVDKLQQLGPKLIPPHVKKLRGERDLLELRPRAGDSPIRPICARTAEAEYVILAFATDKADFGGAVKRAQVRMLAHTDRAL
ncbi:MAG: type II toxin-antitoxin system RelE/ParE family toxin [Thermoleophilia bacterium]|nr:type II toxin-antitoxin system RelE/ParE family toxin [Thermoleophilia bacterium]